jgi:hypothetical protein
MGQREMLMQQRDNIEPINLGGGVIVFKNAINLDWNHVYTLCSGLIKDEHLEMYQPGVDPETGNDIYFNKSGYIFTKNSIDEMPKRASRIHQIQDTNIKSIFNEIERLKDECLLRYFEQFPLSYNCVWWKVKGHIVSYGPDVYLGSHSDISAEYIYGVHKTNHELALRNVITSLVYLNDSVDTDSELNEYNYTKGHHYFNYLDIEYKPKAGDILMFPSNYIAAHEVKPVGSGVRFSYLGWYSQGTPNPSVNEEVCDPVLNPGAAAVGTNIYMPDLRDNYRRYLKSKGYSEYSDQYKVTNFG